MKSAPFLFGVSLDDVIAQTRSLSDDFTFIRDRGGPSATDLIDAPILDHFGIVARVRPALAGVVSAHPILGSDRLITTSEIYAIDTDAGWARTYSRFYRLGRPGTARGRDQ